jgi:RimJ/RimL family protein N-acetyltransferase
MVADIQTKFPLSSNLVKLKQFEIPDITEQYLSWLNDTEVVKYSNQRFIKHTKESCMTFYNSFIDSPSLFIAIEDELRGNVIGTLTIHCNVNHETADVGIMLGDKSYWGKGYAKQAWCLVIDLLSDVINVRKVTAGTLACNLSMLGLMKASRMELDGTRANQEIVGGQPVDIVYYARYHNI